VYIDPNLAIAVRKRCYSSGMKLLATIGTPDQSITYTDRHTVKIVIANNNNVLILNDGLLPGGGVDNGENDQQAIKRELLEELGARVDNIQPIGTVIQYRDFLKKRYSIHGYTANLLSLDDVPEPQDEGEEHFVLRWLTTDGALDTILASIKLYENINIGDDNQQGKLYNLLLAYALVDAAVGFSSKFVMHQ